MAREAQVWRKSWKRRGARRALNGGLPRPLPEVLEAEVAAQWAGEDDTVGAVLAHAGEGTLKLVDHELRQ